MTTRPSGRAPRDPNRLRLIFARWRELSREARVAGRVYAAEQAHQAAERWGRELSR